ncbi:MAG: aldehyde dehydrogenase family protein, partial [Myxococcales bacterium]|nr:aldehyde dehydrogenase family protein [Myxococcales bacterium]
MQGMGDFIGGRFLGGEGEALRSVDPATGSVVCETAWSADRADQAVGAAEAALDGWRALSLDARAEHLARFREAIVARKEPIAEAISLEMGKLRTEARTEVAALVGRFDLMLARIRSDMRDGALAGHPMEALVHRPHGVVGVVGPFNFPLHLCHAHVVPALLLGNTVVMKPSERTPLAGQRYAEAAEAAGLPAGVLNVVNGAGALGAGLLQAKALRALCFTGSWPTGRRILESLLDRPEVLVALEMGGKNA